MGRYRIRDGVLIMATLYYNAAVDSDWSNINNWWDDAGFSTQASSLPSSSDSVVMSAMCATSSGGAPTVVDLTYNNSGLGIAITVTGMATFNGQSYNYYNGIVSGDATFNDYASNYSTVGGHATFNDSSYNSGPPGGDATFNDSSYNSNYGTVSGDGTFNNSSYNNGTVSGDATFNDNASNSVSSLNGGSITFNDSASNSGDLASVAAAISITGTPVDASSTLTGTFIFTRVSPWPPLRGINGSSILGVI